MTSLLTQTAPNSLPADAAAAPLDIPVAVVIPMYRVEPYIREVIAGVPEWVSRIIVVDDASPDGSAEAALAAGDARVVLVRHKENQGVGGAMLSGFARAFDLGAQVAVKMDGDGQMPVEFLWEMVEPILAGRADYTKGNRFFHVDEIVRMPVVRRLGNLGLSFLTKLASGYWNVFDPTNGFVALHQSVFSALDVKRIHRRYFFETSMLIELNLIRAVVLDVPMPARYRGEISSLSVSRSLFTFAYYLLRGFFRRLWLTYFVLDFSPGSLYMVMGALMGLFGTAWGLYFWNKSTRTGVPASTGTVMIAVLPVILGFQMLLQALAHDIQNVPRSVLPRSTRRNPPA
jgi:glycosyltransferase involved in cell wall biosynthesis